MYALWTLLALLPPPAGLAADRTETIPLRCASAVQLDRMLRPGAADSLVPSGLVAITLDPQGNTLTVSGSDESIQEFKNLVRLLDVPAKRIRLSARFIPLDGAAIQELKLPVDAAAPLSGSPYLVGAPSANQLALLAKRESAGETDLAVSNNTTLRLRSRATEGRLTTFAEVIPRLNGDGSVTLYTRCAETAPGAAAWQRADRPAFDAPGALWDEAVPVATCRVQPGQSVLVLLLKTGTALLVTFREVLPPAGG